MARSHNHSASYFKSKPHHEPSSGRTFLIVTEGLRTEPRYFEALCERLRLGSADVKIVHPEGTDPVTLTNAAIELREDRERRAKKDNSILPYDEVWVVFDLEKPHDQRRTLAVKARTLPGADKIFFAESDPCFEFWLLMHFRFTTAPHADCRSVTKELKKHLSEYAKGSVPSPGLIEKLPVAVKNSRRCRKHHQDGNGSGNASTSVDILAENLNSSVRKSIRIV